MSSESVCDTNRSLATSPLYSESLRCCIDRLGPQPYARGADDGSRPEANIPRALSQEQLRRSRSVKSGTLRYMRNASLLLATLAVVSLDVRAADATERKPIPGDCPVTLPHEPRFTPAERQGPSQTDGFWHGSEALAVYLVTDGRWYTGEPPKDFTQHLFFYRQNRDWHEDRPSPELAVTAKRLDVEGGELPNISRATPVWAEDFLTMMVTLYLPERGCWKITGRYNGDYLAFVVWVD
jgi:hypothetical protein